MEEQIEINHSNVPIRLFKSDSWNFYPRPPGDHCADLAPFFAVHALVGVSATPAKARLVYLPADSDRVVRVDLHGVQHPPVLLPLLPTHRLAGTGCLPLPRRSPCPAADEDAPGDAAGSQHPDGRQLLIPVNLLVGRLLGQPHWVGPLASGFTLGYLTYDLMHYATHHFPMRWGVFRSLKRHHMHHYKTPNQRFGVSSPLWDSVWDAAER